jgi:hypothetical protein
VDLRLPEDPRSAGLVGQVLVASISRYASCLEIFSTGSGVLVKIGRKHVRDFDAGHAPSGGAAQRVLTELRTLAKHMASPAATAATPVRSVLDDLRARRAARLTGAHDRERSMTLGEDEDSASPPPSEVQ